MTEELAMNVAEIAEMKRALVSIQTEYIEMPGLKLSLRQAQRLFDLPAEICNDALTILLTAGFLAESKDGSFVRRGGVPLSIETLGLVARPPLVRPARDRRRHSAESIEVRR
jgi:hypothetical protein